MIYYKIKHIPTGAYYITNLIFYKTNNKISNRGNFSLKGEIYTKRPCKKQIPEDIRVVFNPAFFAVVGKAPKLYVCLAKHFKIPLYEGFTPNVKIDKYFKVPKTDWLIEKFNFNTE
jgi:hypothetical protein